MKNVFTKLYILGFMVLTVFFIIIIWKVTFAHIIEEFHSRKEALEIAEIKEEQKKEKGKTTFEKIIIESEERVKHYLGYKVLEEQRIEGHFHHIGFDIGPDKRSYCIECHGDMPHDNIKELRAFLNMHAFFINCQTCHIKLEESEKTGVFKWYDRTTGEIVDSPVKTSKPGTYKAKIVPFEYKNGELVRLDSQERTDFAREYKEKEKTLTEAQRSKAKKLIHNIVGKNPHICEDCHQKESPLLPLQELGYPKERADSIVST
ncbi:MAG: hypothetical protein KAJ59_05305, partial [Thermodesulfovibrionia bacterium]|nr:hypothetical protein [Thermodesulfovibrionia bacterium]